MRCELCRVKLTGKEERFCSICLEFLEWKYKDEFKERLEYDGK